MQVTDHFTVAGVDVSKATLDFAIGGRAVTRRVDYDGPGLATLTDACVRAGVTLVVLEATGGLERRLVRALAAADLSFHVANPRQVRDLARALGRLAKTDAIDARMLVEYGSKLRPAPHVLPDENRQKLRDLSARHQQLSDTHAAETNRRKTCEDATINAMIDGHLAFIDAQIETVAHAMDELIDADAAMARDADAIRSVPGLGRLTARRLVADLPELGRCTPRQIAKLVGLAPINRDSGTLRGKRTTGGGRRAVRKLLYMPTLVATRHNPLIRSMYLRLLAAGKPKMVALVACMRKLLILLNAMIRERKTWDQFVQWA
jgi:transposase